MPSKVRWWLRALANLSGPGYCLANWRLALRNWTADIIMAVSFVSDPEPTWQMIRALLRCKQCKPGIFSVKSGDKPPKMKQQRFCDSLYSVCRVPGPRLMSWRGWWGPGAASSRIPRESPESGESWHSQVIICRKHLINILPVALSLCFCSKYLSLLVGKSLSLPWSFIDDESKTLWWNKKNLESLWKRARPREPVTGCQWESSGRKTRAMWPLMRRRVGFETKLIYLILQLGEMSPRHRWWRWDQSGSRYRKSRSRNDLPSWMKRKLLIQL